MEIFSHPLVIALVIAVVAMAVWVFRGRMNGIGDTAKPKGGGWSWDFLFGENGKLNHPFVFGLVVAAVVIAGVYHDAAAIWLFILDTSSYMTTFLVMVTGALAITWYAKFVRHRRWYDNDGAAVEMGMIRGRINTPQETDRDPIAIAMQYVIETVFLIVVCLGKIIHQAAAI